MLVVLGLLTAKLWYLQLIQGESYVELAQSNRLRLIRLPPSRGRIFDCKGLVLADNQPGFSLGIVRGELKKPQDLVEAGAPILGILPERMRTLIERSSTVPRFMPFPVKKNMTLEEVSLFKSQLTDLKGAVLEAKPRRVHPLGETSCHTLGTVGEISTEDLAKNAHMGYRPGDLVGKSGIEQEYEPYLKGMEGWEQIEIDARGRQLGIVSRRMPEQGADIELTIDASLQRFVEEIFTERAGSVVVVEADTGRILSMVSKPGFDLGLFSPSISERQWRNLNNDLLHPLENRSIRGLYAPASTFKIVTAVAALAEKVVRPEQKFNCKGELELAGQAFRCWNRYGHGKVSFHRALVESCDIYFYELGLKLGPERIARYASMFGFGKPTGIKLPQEMPGLIPTPAWKQRTHGDSWKDGETLNLAIGQGYLVSTPIQIAMMTAAICNGGKVLRPAIVKQIQGPDGRIIFDHEPVVLREIPLDPRDLAELQSALLGVVSERAGTGKKCRIPGIKVAGKTGTSQVIRHKQRTDEYQETPYHERAHAIFVAYVDRLPSKIAVVVIAEHGGAGGQSAAPLARKIICRYYGVPDPGDPKE
jgi:penicillin-binding protein 2